MASPKQATAYNFGFELVSQSDVKLFQNNPTLAAGDFKISKDFGAFSNLATLPTVTPSSTRQVKAAVSGTEFTADDAGIEGIDAAGAEWCDVGFHFSLTVRNADDLAFPTTSGRSIDTDTAGNVDARLADAVSHGGTLGSGTATLALAKQWVIGSDAAFAVMRVENTGGAPGISSSGTNTGMKISGESNSSVGLELSGGDNALYVGAYNGPPVFIEQYGSGGAGEAFGPAVKLTATGDHGISITAAGSGKHGIFATGGTNGDGMRLVGNGTGADLNLAGTTYATGYLKGVASPTFTGDGVQARLGTQGKADVNAEVVDVISTDTRIDGKTIEAALEYIAASACGKVSGAGTATETFLGIDGATTRLTITVDASGNRTAITYS